MDETLAEVLPDLINSLLRGVHTAFPGKIEKYDRSTYRAEVTPLIKVVTAKNIEIPIQVISDIPVLMIGGSSGIIDIELVKGDNVLVVICESGIGGWKSTKGDKQISPDDLSNHELNNAIAIPCIIPDGLINSFSDVPRIKIDKNGDLTMLSGNGKIGINNSTGQANINGNLTVDV